MSDGEIDKAISSTIDREAVLEIIMDAYGDRIKRLVYSYVKDWGTASDLTQEVFVTAYMKLETFERRSSFKTWIFTIAVNKCKDYLKSWHYRNMVMNEKVFSFMKDKSKTPEEQVLRNDENRELLDAIWGLPLKYREVFLLHYYQDLSLQEMSTTLGIPITTVKTRLFRGKEKLKRFFPAIKRGENHG
ncbi:sigma-70 family RNA polymerase sigma factor [Neobacillus vireti]|uniref:RNA polymerase factor sigma C n=1 Tax=Neobacillus vireti LMG 21834 TaxID=1131730 RepID=A0AB94IKQ2_9BACI|nr:sigma-70 family RNA polymerase sigma factor [Neobacillus vireti]ETI67587.1 RNA polymerase factor sigma C [Neobacillus vireti LMG 21834]KLT18465.1 RNA polymerase factor sigma C [Neobacillus vireti]